MWDIRLCWYNLSCYIYCVIVVDKPWYGLQSDLQEFVKHYMETYNQVNILVQYLSVAFPIVLLLVSTAGSSSEHFIKVIWV